MSFGTGRSLSGTNSQTHVVVGLRSKTSLTGARFDAGSSLLSSRARLSRRGELLMNTAPLALSGPDVRTLGYCDEKRAPKAFGALLLARSPRTINVSILAFHQKRPQERSNYLMYFAVLGFALGGEAEALLGLDSTA